MVEAAGVEPASETVTGKKNYMLIRFLPPVFTGNVRGPRLETGKKRVPLACGSRPRRPDVAQRTSLQMTSFHDPQAGPQRTAT